MFTHVFSFFSFLFSFFSLTQGFFLIYISACRFLGNDLLSVNFFFPLFLSVHVTFILCFRFMNFACKSFKKTIKEQLID